MDALVLEYREILMNQYARTDPKLYYINKFLTLIGDKSKPKSINHLKRRALTPPEADRLKEIASTLRSFPLPIKVIYYANML